MWHSGWQNPFPVPARGSLYVPLTKCVNARSLRWLWENIFGDPGLTWGPLGQTGSVSSV